MRRGPGPGPAIRLAAALAGWREPLIVLAVALPLFLWGLGRPPLQDPDEGLFGSIAREMVEEGDWLTPRFDGLRYLEKPPLYHWLTALTLAVAGASEWSVRLWSALGAVGTVLLTALLGREAFGPRTGLLGGLLGVTTLGLFRYGRFVGVDLLFTTFVTLAVLAFLRWRRAPGWGPAAALYVAAALATMTKGVLGLVLPALVVGVSLLLPGERPPLRALGLAWGVPLVGVLVLPWHLLVAHANPGFLSYFVVETHVVRFLRGTQALEDEVPLSAAGFLLATAVWLLPWSLFLPSAVLDVARRWRALPGRERHAWVVMAVWSGSVLLLFSLSAFRLEHYALPAFPPLLLLAAALWAQAPAGRALGLPVVAGAAGAAVLAATVFGLGPWVTAERMDTVLAAFDVYFRMLLDEGLPLPVPPVAVLLGAFRAVAICLLVGFGGATIALRRGRPRVALGALLAGATGLIVTVGLLIGAFAPGQTVKGIAGVLGRVAGPGDLVIYEGYLENAGGLPFYTGRQIHVLGPPRGDLAFGARFAESRGLFHRAADLPALWAGPRRVFLVIDRPPGRSALAGLPAASRHQIVADHGRWLYSNRAE